MKERIDKSLFAKVRKIQIKTSRMVTEIFSGEYRSVFKGQGMEFEEVREYQSGDEIRTIDWNVTARMNKPFVKQFKEERELTVFFLVDVSASMDCGTRVRTKRELMAELCAVLAFAAIQNNDKVGLIAFSDHIEKYVPPAKGKKHVLRVIRELLAVGQSGVRSRRTTNLRQSLDYLGKVYRKKAVVFLVSDYLAEDYAKPLNVLAHKHDLIALHVEDPLETQIPANGIFTMEDLETGQPMEIDFSTERLRQKFQNAMEERKEKLFAGFKKIGIDVLSTGTAENYFHKLVLLFKEREKRR